MVKVDGPKLEKKRLRGLALSERKVFSRETKFSKARS